ncbi:MAG TPA: hypothetical protein VGK87_15110 [Anaerolineae bacterium]
MQRQRSVSSSTTTRMFPVRLARLLRTFRVVLIVLVIAAILTIALSALDNAFAPTVQLSHTADGPEALSVVRALEIDAKTGDLFAGSNGGLFRSTDGGLNWLPASHGLSGIDVQDLMYDPDTHVMYAVLYGAGLFRSVDDGQSWQGLGRGMRGDKLITIAKDPRIDTMYAGLDGYGMYTSLDEGASWSTVGFGVSNTYIHQILIGDDPGEVFVATDSGLWHSSNVTQTWDLLTSRTTVVKVLSLLKDSKSNTTLVGTDHGILKVERQNDSFLVNLTGLADGMVTSLLQDAKTGTLIAGTLNGVYLSDDGATTWKPFNNGLRSTLVQTLLIKPMTGELLAGTNSGVFITGDNGANWRAAEQSPSARHVQSVFVNPQDGEMFAGTLGGGVFYSKNQGASWMPANMGLSNAVVQAFGIDHGLNTLYAGTRSGLYRTSLNAFNWSLAAPQFAGQDIQTIAVDERHGNAYVITANGDVIRSSSDGAKWESIQAINQSVFARTVAVSSFSSAVYVGAYKGGVLVSRDFGATWHSLGGYMPDKNVETVAVDERNGTVYAGTLSGGVYQLKNENSGWVKIGKENEQLPGNIIALAVDEKYGGLFAAVKYGLFRVGEGEQTWVPVMEGMTHDSILSLAYDRANGAIIAGVMAGGAFRSVNSGLAWKPISNGLTDSEMRGIVVDDASGALSVSVTDRGVYQSDDGGATWRAANAGLGELTVGGLSAIKNGASQSLVVETRQLVVPEVTVGVIQLPPALRSQTVLTVTRQYASTDITAGWQRQSTSVGNLFELLDTVNSFGVAARMANGEMLWAIRGGGGFSARLSGIPGLVNATVRQLPDGRNQFYAVWGDEILQSEPAVGYAHMPLLWMVVRVWSWQGLRALNNLFPQWWLMFIVAAGLILAYYVLSRIRFSRSFGVPLYVTLFAPQRSTSMARRDALDKAWPKWERAIQRQLFAHGDAAPGDVSSIPAPFRLYALQRYAQAHGKGHSVQLDGAHLRAAGRIQIRRWASAWDATRADMQHEGATWLKRKHVDQLASAFSIALELDAQPGRDVDAVRAYSTIPVEAAQYPSPIALLFIADNESLAHSVKNLTDALAALDVSGAIGIVISLGRPGRDVDVSAQIASAVAEAGAAGRLLVLRAGEISGIISSSEPVQALKARLKTMH